jgi:hypothetical protein
MYFDRFDICEAYYAFATDYHGGQWSPEYAILGRLQRMGYRAGFGGVTYDALTENGKAIYDNLVSKLER